VVYQNKENLLLLPLSTHHFKLWAAVLKVQKHCSVIESSILTEDRDKIYIYAAD
jgi:hypothetical protein